MKQIKFPEFIASSVLSLSLISCQNPKIDKISEVEPLKTTTENNVGITPKVIEINPVNEMQMLRKALIAAHNDSIKIEKGVVIRQVSLTNFEEVTGSSCLQSPEYKFESKCYTKDKKTYFKVEINKYKGNFGVDIQHMQPVPNGTIINNVYISDFRLGHISSSTQPYENPPQEWTTLSKDCFTGKNISPKIPITFFQIDAYSKNSGSSVWARFNSQSIKDSFVDLEKAVNNCKLEK